MPSSSKASALTVACFVLSSLALIDRTASALHRSANPASLEAKIREGQKADPKFSFLNSSDPYSTYYRYAQARLREGIVDASAPVAGGAEADLTGEAARRAAVDDRPKEPRALDFVLERPGMPPIDLDVLKLTALFTARRGRSFLASLSQREGRNFQFDFLRPTHSLYPLFQRLVGQYERVLAPAQEALAALESGKRKREGRASALEQARERSEWEKWRKERNKKRADELEARESTFLLSAGVTLGPTSFNPADCAPTRQSPLPRSTGKTLSSSRRSTSPRPTRHSRSRRRRRSRSSSRARSLRSARPPSSRRSPSRLERRTRLSRSPSRRSSRRPRPSSPRSAHARCSASTPRARAR